MNLKPLLAFTIAGIAALAVAPSAHAGWMTGQGNLPLIGYDAVCRDGIEVKYATYYSPPPLATLDLGTSAPQPTRAPGGAPVPVAVTTPGPLTLHGLGIWLADTAAFPVVSPADYTVPYQPLLLDPPPSGIDSWPAAPGELTHSARYTLAFNRPLTPGTRVAIAWQRTAGAAYRYQDYYAAVVEDCSLRPQRAIARPLPFG
jgi:hypothetical protein